MKTESRLFLMLVPFFLVAGAAYGFLTDRANGHPELVGTLAILLVGGLVAMIGGYLVLTAKRIDPRPEDNPLAEIDDGAGDQGVFAPWSWWPLAAAASAGLVFLGLAVGWWVFIIGAAFGVISLIGWVFEFSRGQHAH